MEPYADSVEHLGAELVRLDVLLKRELALVRSAPAQVGDDLRGLVIGEREIEAIAQQDDCCGERWRQEARMQEVVAPLDARAEDLRREIDERCACSRDLGIFLALPALAERFGLTRREVDLLVLALAPEIESRYELLFGYLQDDVTRRRPSVDLALKLVARTMRERLAARRLLQPGAPLVDHRLIDFGEESHDREPSWLRRVLRTDQTVVDAILGVYAPGVGTRLAADPEVDEESRERLVALAAHLKRDDGQRALVQLVSSSDAALRSAAEWLAAELGCAPAFTDPSELEREDVMARRARDAMLTNRVLSVVMGTASDPETPAQLAGLSGASAEQLLRTSDLMLVLAPPGGLLRATNAHRVWVIELRPPGAARRRSAWEDGLQGAVTSEEIGQLAESFRFGSTRIAQTLAVADGLARLRDPDTRAPGFSEVVQAGRLLATSALRRFATRVEPQFEWSDLVLPADRVARLQRLASWVRLRHHVHERWGFGRKLVRGRGLSVLFAGPSGTGKTMAAEVLAKDLGLDLYQIDLSSVVSKYIGETEKHLSAIFREAEDSQAILFFDEADALFGKRTEVKDAHDRYANIETSFLLQRVERYDGLVVLASNQQRNIDDAFLRRLHDVIEFPLPDEAQRTRIWRSQFPEQAEVDADVDLDFLGRQFKVTGANIKNIVVDAAFRAATRPGRIAMEDLVLATRAELQKEGRLPTRIEFDRYYDLILTTNRQLQ